MVAGTVELILFRAKTQRSEGAKEEGYNSGKNSGSNICVIS
jgi:hypothetical protein